VRCSYDESLSYYQFRHDKDCVAWFDELKELAHRVKVILSVNVSMETLLSKQWDTFRSMTQYHMCEKSFALDDTCIRDHCYLIERYNGPAHSNCNLNYKKIFNEFLVIRLPVVSD